jgi:hypothetical protein
MILPAIIDVSAVMPFSLRHIASLFRHFAAITLIFSVCLLPYSCHAP